jgi:hypothetical protein
MSIYLEIGPKTLNLAAGQLVNQEISLTNNSSEYYRSIILVFQSPWQVRLKQTTFSLGNLEPGASKSVDLEMKVTADPGQSFSLELTIHADGKAPQTENLYVVAKEIVSALEPPTLPTLPPTTIKQFRRELSKFTEDELADFCQDYFPDIYRNFTKHTSIQERIRQILDYCERRNIFPDLHEALQKTLQEDYSFFSGKSDESFSDPLANVKSHGPNAKAIIQTEKDGPSKSEPFPGYAVLIGVGADLAVTVQDATSLADLLRDPARCAFPPGQVHLLTESEATRANVLSVLDTLAQSVGPNSTAIVYFSGHGYRVELPGQPTMSFLLTYGYEVNNLPNMAISSAEFTAKLRAIRAKKLLVLLDCCHAGSIAQPKAPGVTLIKSPLPLQTEAVLAEGSGRVVLASSRGDELSYTSTPYSHFTLALLEALSGAGAAEKDGYARVLDVALYVGRMVPNRTGDNQHPIFNVSNLENNFALAYYAGGAKEPLPLPQTIGMRPAIRPIAIDARLAEGYRTLLCKYRRNLLEIEKAMAEFIDQRTVPLDLLRMRDEVLKKIAELEQGHRVE